MSEQRRDVIQRAYAGFEGSLRLARWAAIDAALERAELPMMTSDERDEVDIAAATGCVPFDDEPEAPAACPAVVDDGAGSDDDCVDLLAGHGICQKCEG